MSFLKEFLNQVEEGYLLLDRQGLVLFCNDFLIRRGLIRENYENRPYYECIGNLSVVSCLAESFSNGKGKVCHFYHGDRDYSLYTFVGSDMVVVRCTDVTELKRYERSKREFVANVSHELKTPIAVLKSILETLYEEEDREEKKTFLERAIRRVEDMGNLVEDLLIITKLESGEERLKRETFSLRSLVDEVFDFLSEEAQMRDVSLENSVEEGFMLNGDKDKLFLLLKNLVDNAIKYNRRGGKVRVSSSMQEGHAVIRVEDTGIGIPKEHIPFIFDRFYRVDPSRSKELGGTGLGLSIVKHIALSHGGRVEVESSEGKGSTFRVYLPTL